LPLSITIQLADGLQINGTAYEHDPNSNQMRHGGDLQGLVDTLDYLQGMGIKVCDDVPRVERAGLIFAGCLHSRLTLHQ
jgi:alpha-1,3-glucan synthase